MGNEPSRIRFRQTEVYAAWFDGLRDERAIARIPARLRRLTLGNPDDVRSVGEGVSEMRIDYGPGYRVYYKQAGAEIVLLLCGGAGPPVGCSGKNGACCLTRTRDAWRRDDEMLWR